MINKRHVKTYCKEYWKIENYDLAMSDTTQTWECHHRNEQYYKMKDLIKLGLYYDCPPCELIFLTQSEHNKTLHAGRSGLLARQKMSDRRKGRVLSDETKQKIGQSNKGLRKGKTLTNEWKEKIGNASRGRRWYNNGIKSVFTFECPEGFVPGRISWK